MDFSQKFNKIIWNAVTVWTQTLVSDFRPTSKWEHSRLNPSILCRITFIEADLLFKCVLRTTQAPTTTTVDPIQALVNQQQAAAQQQTAMQQKVQQLMQQKLQEKLGSMAPEKQQLYSSMLGVPVSQTAQEQINLELCSVLFSRKLFQFLVWNSLSRCRLHQSAHTHLHSRQLLAPVSD